MLPRLLLLLFQSSVSAVGVACVCSLSFQSWEFPRRRLFIFSSTVFTTMYSYSLHHDAHFRQLIITIRASTETTTAYPFITGWLGFVACILGSAFQWAVPRRYNLFRPRNATIKSTCSAASTATERHAIICKTLLLVPEASCSPSYSTPLYVMV